MPKFYPLSNKFRTLSFVVMAFAFAATSGSLTSCKAKQSASSSSKDMDATSTAGMSVVMTKGDIKVYGGTGESFEDPIVIVGAKSSMDGVPVEYAYLAKKYGERGTDWQMNQQSLQYHEGKAYDVLNITVVNPKKEKFDVYFDISGFFGKW